MNLSFERVGSGEPLLLIQGVSGHRRMWGEAFLNALAQDFDVVAYDHRGIGESDRPDGKFSMEDLADDAVELMDRLGWESAHIAGISMGGMVGQELALKYPQRVRSLTLGCTSSRALSGHGLVRGLLRMVRAKARGKEKSLRAGYEANLSPAFISDSSNYGSYVETVESIRVPAPVTALQLTAATGFDVSARIADLDMPVLILHGTADKIIPVAHGHELAARIPRATLGLLDGAAHLFWWEYPGKSAELIREHALQSR